MSKERELVPCEPLTRTRAVDRRQALRGLGALAVFGPALGTAACGSDVPVPFGSTGSGGTDGKGGARKPEQTASGGAAGRSTRESVGGGGSQDIGGSPGTSSSHAGGSAGESSVGKTEPRGGAAGAGGRANADAGGGKSVAGESGGTISGSGGHQHSGTGGDRSGELDAGADGGGRVQWGGDGGGPRNVVDATASLEDGGGFALATPDMFANVASCTLTATDTAGEGPFFIHDEEVMNDPVLFRNDLRDGRSGIELWLHLRMLDSSKSCTSPISDVEVYVWHTDASGLYSGFNEQNPDQPYSGSAERTPQNNGRFCRGAQLTSADGIVSFRTIYPGWYNGRPIHIHFLSVRKGASPATTGADSYRGAKYQIFTTQMYFDETISRRVHENNAPYKARASGSAYDTYVKPNPNSQVRPTLKFDGNMVVGALNVMTSPATPRR